MAFARQRRHRSEGVVVPVVGVNNVDLYCKISGDFGDPLVLVHGSWVDHHNWDAVAPAFSQTFRVLTYDRRGHSQSQRPARPSTMREHVADLAALIERLGLQPAHVAGNSLGGSIALRLAGERPELLRSVIVHEPPLIGLLRDEPGRPQMLETVSGHQRTVLERLRAGDSEGAARLFLETMAFGPGSWNRLSSNGRETLVKNAQTFLDESNDPEAFTIDRTRLASIRQPVLVTRGSKSPAYLRAITAILARFPPHVTVKTFIGAGHAPHLSHPAEFVETVRGFLNHAGAWAS